MMKTTYPIKWKGTHVNGNMIEGKTLTTRGHFTYGISSDSIYDVVLNHLNGIDVKKDSIYWMCRECYEWNYYKEIICKCGCILENCKDNIINA